MKVSGLLVAAAASALAFTAHRAAAATGFDLSLNVDEVTQTWSAYGQVSGDLTATSGLSGIIFSVVGSNGVTVTDSVNQMPIGDVNNATFAQSGFWFGASNGTAGVNIEGIQLSPEYYQDPTTGDTNVLSGVGLTAGSQSGATWSYPVLLATGSYSGTTGNLTISNTTEQVLLLPAVLPTPDATGNVGIQTMWPDSVSGQNVPIYILGDADGNGVVNLNDFVAWSLHFGQTGAGWSGGDFDGNGIVNLNDFVTWSLHFGQTAPAGQMAGAASGVPEPASVGLLALGAMALLRRRRSR